MLHCIVWAFSSCYTLTRMYCVASDTLWLTSFQKQLLFHPNLYPLYPVLSKCWKSFSFKSDLFFFHHTINLRIFPLNHKENSQMHLLGSLETGKQVDWTRFHLMPQLGRVWTISSALHDMSNRNTYLSKSTEDNWLSNNSLPPPPSGSNSVIALFC